MNFFTSAMLAISLSLSFTSIGRCESDSGELQESCKTSSIRCVGKKQEYTSIQNAVDAANPGDFVWIRGGNYAHSRSDKRRYITVNRSGEPTRPITIEAFPDETVHIIGWGFSDEGKLPEKSGEVLLVINGDYITVRNLHLSQSTRAAINANGDYGVYEDLTIHDNWLEGIVACRDPYDDEDSVGNIFRSIHIFRTRHGTGWTMAPRSPLANSSCDRNTLEYSLLHSNGFDGSGEKVGAIRGDPAGGGNSDGFSLGKRCSDASLLGRNLCTNFVARYNIAWHNADDGIDVSPGEGAIIDSNISFDNGPEGNRGVKVLKSVAAKQFQFIGNIIFSNGLRGFEIRSQSHLQLFHNSVFSHPTHGYYLRIPSPTTDSVKVLNNLSRGNQTDDRLVSTGTVKSNLWNKSFQEDFQLSIPPELLSGALAKAEISERWSTLFAGIHEIVRMNMHVDQIDSGVFIDGVHCLSADDDGLNPQQPTDNCRHWLGHAPDIGAVEIQ